MFYIFFVGRVTRIGLDGSERSRREKCPFWHKSNNQQLSLDLSSGGGGGGGIFYPSEKPLSPRDWQTVHNMLHIVVVHGLDKKIGLKPISL
jgi:hypothetical protein